MDPTFVAHMKSGLPELPEDPKPEQVDAWIELAELVQDTSFQASIRRMSEQHAAARASGEDLRPDAGWQQAAALVTERSNAALAAGLDPASPEAQAIVDEVLPAFPGDHDRAALADRFATGSDPKAERYWQLMAIINGWPPVPTTAPAWEWFIAALRTDPVPSARAEQPPLGDLGAVEAQRAGRADVRARPLAAAVLDRIRVVGLDAVVDLLGDGIEVHGGGLLRRHARVEDHDRQARLRAQVAGVPRVRARQPQQRALAVGREPHRGRPRQAVRVRGGERHVVGAGDDRGGFVHAPWTFAAAGTHRAARAISAAESAPS